MAASKSTPIAPSAVAPGLSLISEGGRSVGVQVPACRLGELAA